MTINFDDYDDAGLGVLLNEVRTEQEKRANLARIPLEMAEMQARFIAQGGDQETIAAALAAPLPAPEPDPVYEPVEEAAVAPEGDESAQDPTSTESD